YNGWIGFDMAVAMVLGQNIGTTITANLAALVTNSTAKQAAMAHLIFNVFGVILAIVFFRTFENMVFGIMNAFDMKLPNMLDGKTLEEANAAMPIALSVYHTIFNLANTLILIWFVPHISKVVKQIIRTKGEDDVIFKLHYINTGLLNFDELSALQARKEIDVFMQRTVRMYKMVKEILDEDKPKKLEKTYARIEKYEQIADRMDEEIVTFLTQITRSDVSKKTSTQASAMIKLVSRIESISDSCYILAQQIMLSKNKKTRMNDDMVKNLKHMFTKIDTSINKLNTTIEDKSKLIYVESERHFRDQINDEVEKLNIEHLKAIKKGIYKYKVGIIYCDLFTEQGVLADHCYHSLKYIDELNAS
ncbi:MAG TPA: Na/Pi symporter, partial [Prolixibacteraceae bacterium]|nr:Na/Pi symporter [Prolixibacteraceae bacterium]